MVWVKNIVIIFGILAISGMSTCLAAGAEKQITLSISQEPPYTDETRPGYGLLGEIVSAAFERAGYAVTYRFYPWKRALHSAKTGKTDGVVNVLYTDERAEFLVYSDPFYDIRISFFTVKEKKIIYQDLKDLAPYKIGVLLGSRHEDKLRKAGLNVEAVPLTEQNIRKLLTNRIDLSLMETVPTFEVLSTRFTKAERVQVLLVGTPFILKTHVGICKKRPGSQAIAEKFNHGLEMIRSDGLYKTILERYGDEK
jgi:polar amino acid transport system substrate-binding protein